MEITQQTIKLLNTFPSDLISYFIFSSVIQEKQKK